MVDQVIQHSRTGIPWSVFKIVSSVIGIQQNRGSAFKIFIGRGFAEGLV